MGLFDFLKKLTGSDSLKKQVSVNIHVPTPDSYEAQKRTGIVKIQQLDNHAHLSANGLKPSEILLLSYAESFFTDSSSFSRFWLYDYGIDNPRAIINKLLDKELIAISSAADNLSRMTVAELKTELEKLGLPTKGRKATLIEQLTSNVNSEQLEKIVTSRKYVLTELGKAEVVHNEYVPFLHDHKHYGISIWEVNQALHEHPKSRWRDIIWGEFNKGLLDQASETSYGNYSTTVVIYDNMVDFLMWEKRYKNALSTAAICSYYRMNHTHLSSYKMSMKNYRLGAEPRMKRIQNPETGKNELIEDHSQPRLMEYIIPVPYEMKIYETIRRELNLDNEGMWNILLNALKKLCKPSNVLQAEDIAGIIIGLLDGDENIVSTVCSSAEKRITQNNHPSTPTLRR